MAGIFPSLWLCCTWLRWCWVTTTPTHVPLWTGLTRGNSFYAGSSWCIITAQIKLVYVDAGWGGSSIPFWNIYNMQYIIPPGDVDANLNLPDMVIDIFTLSVKCYLIICYDQIHDVFNLTSNHYVPTYHDNIGSYFYFSLFTTESIVL